MVRRLNNNRGIALVLVLWVLTLLSVLVGEFAQTMRTEINITRNFKEETLTYYIAKAGINLALDLLLFNGRLPISDEMDGFEAEEDGFEWHMGSDVPPIPFANGTIEINIENESGKININTAESGLLKMMLNPFDLDEAEKDIIVDSILDWRDKDDFHRLNGAESDYYQSLSSPYSAKNGDFDSIDELLLVKGVTSELFYGGLKEMVTIYPKTGQLEKQSLGSNRININAAPSRVLLALPQMTDDLVLSVLEYRSEQPFQSIAQVPEVVGSEVYSAIFPYITTNLVPQYTIRAVGTIPGSRTRRGVQTVIAIDPEEKNLYNILEWLDNIEIRPKNGGVAP